MADLHELINFAAEFKRKREFLNADMIYYNLDNKYKNNPIIHKSWAKNFAAWGYFDESLKHFEKALSIAINNNEENAIFQCQIHVDMMTQFKSHNYDEEYVATNEISAEFGVMDKSMSFKDYIKSLSGNWQSFTMPIYKKEGERKNNYYDRYSQIHTTGLLMIIVANVHNNISEKQVLYIMETIQLLRTLENENVDKEYVKNVFQNILIFYSILDGDEHDKELMHILNWYKSQFRGEVIFWQSLKKDLVRLCTFNGVMHEDEKQLIDLITKVNI